MAFLQLTVLLMAEQSSSGVQEKSLDFAVGGIWARSAKVAAFPYKAAHGGPRGDVLDDRQEKVGHMRLRLTENLPNDP